MEKIIWPSADEVRERLITQKSPEEFRKQYEGGWDAVVKREEEESRASSRNQRG